jgi:tetratricopeptide (TPR) repeat protein
MASILRLTQTAESENKYRVEVALEGGGFIHQTATARFDFKLTTQDHEELRWYLEDFLQYPLDPAPKIAARIENRMVEIGTKLFKDIFQAGEDARDLWAKLRDRLDDTRVEIITEVREAAAIPWELIRDPKTDTPLCLRAHSFVRAHSRAAQSPQLPQTAAGPIRILLVICRPGGSDDVPFRSVASRLIKGLSESAREIFQLDVLRPPTFEQLSRVLRAAKNSGQPYHVVHFDGHGVYADVSKQSSLSDLLDNLSRLLLSGPRTGSHGYLLFENPAEKKNRQLVDGSSLGKLLVETDVPVLVLNACRSAHADPQIEPVAAESDEDPHAKIRAFGSLAHEVMDAGVAGVVAMRYNVYVVTAAQFVAELYASLTRGHMLGDAVTIGRKQLAAQPMREIAYDPHALQDWPVPVVYEAAPIALFPKAAAEKKLTIKLSEAKATPARGTLDAKLPPSPDAGFFGRDETLLALDRAFDTQSIVLLHAYAGNGKTSTASEFARWYSLTGGVDGPVLFTSFEQYKPLARALDDFGQVFGQSLERAGINWPALSDDQRREIALQALEQIPVLWIWDNVEPVAGFPAGTDSRWSAAEQKELADFLRAARGTKAKFLLTSRRDERSWLGDLPARVTLPRMPMQERVQLARALAEKHGRRLIDVADWRPLLEFTQGNPMTITVLVGQALRDGLKTKEQIEVFVRELRAGEAVFENEASEGRSKSLGASLSYGFDNSFSEDECKQLALLHFFQGFVDVDVLCMMGNPQADWSLPEVRGLTREASIALLDRAAEIGLLISYGKGYYSIHPAVPWFFKRLFDMFYPASSDREEARSVKASRAFVEAVGGLGNFYANKYIDGNSNVIDLLTAEESNLLYVRQLAVAHGWWANVIAAMQGLRNLYQHTGRGVEWAQLVNEIIPDFVDPDTDGPLPGREDYWSLVTEYRVHLAEELRQWSEAERLQRLRVEWSRKRAACALTIPQEELDNEQRHYLRTLMCSLHELGEIQRELSQPECIEAYEEALKLSEQIGDTYSAAACAYNLGSAYLDILSLRDLEQAELWFRHSLGMCGEDERQGQARCLAQLGRVAYERFLKARESGQQAEELLRHRNNALQFYSQALELIPSDSVIELGVFHDLLGILHSDTGDISRAMLHYRESIRYEEMRGNVFGAAQTRYNVATLLAQAGRLADAREYAYAALRNFETYGGRAAEQIQQARELIAAIEQFIQEQGG